jgi:hypothetical protein
MLASGEIDQKTFDKWMRETKKKEGKKHPIKPLPERVEKKEAACGTPHGSADGAPKKKKKKAANKQAADIGYSILKIAFDDSAEDLFKAAKKYGTGV